MEDRRFIEETFPVKEVSEVSAKEKSIRQSHISTLHIWWARRPLASSRATNYAALVPVPKNDAETHKQKQFIAKLSKWENSHDKTLFEEARKTILQTNNGNPPKVLDPFAGGGSIPLEALRLGCETYAGDYNPVATLILKCTLEYPQKYVGSSSKTDYGLVSEGHRNRLLDDVEKWGRWVLEMAKKEIQRFYTDEKDGSIPVGYIWARSIPCQNPSCNAEIPLMRQYWLVKKAEKKISLSPIIDKKKVSFRIIGTGYEKFPKDFNPEKGTVSGAVATCLICGSVVDPKSTRRLSASGKSPQRMIAVVLHKEGVSGKTYRIANEEDTKVFEEADRHLAAKRKSLMSLWGIDPVPDEPIHTPDNREYEPGNLLYNFTPVMLYGMTRWGDLFNPRQKLALITFAEKVRLAHKEMIEEGYDNDYARAVVSYLALNLDHIAEKNSSVSRWANTKETIAGSFSRQAVPMVWDYFESNPFSRSTGDWSNSVEYCLNVIKHCSDDCSLPATVFQASATSIPYPKDFFDAVFTDPPYYDNVPYADLSDFFYVWLKRTVGDLYPDLFSTPLTPKREEAIAELPLLRGMGKVEASNSVVGVKTGEHFEKMLLQSFREIRRVLRPSGISVIVYAHKSFAGWETLVNSLLDSGLVVSGAWPIHTEMKSRLRAKESAALASSIYMVARKIDREAVGFYKETKDALKKHLEAKLDMLWNEGISGADFFIAAIGSSIEVFGKYEKIIDDEGNTIRADRLLEDVRRVVTDYAVRQVLHNGFAAEITPLTRFYVLWRWGYGDVKLEFDDALKLARGVGIDITQEWNRGFIKKDKEFVSILGPEERNRDELKGSHELIDVLHHVLLLWNKGRNDEAVNILKETGFGKSDVFYRVAQAISESLPSGREKKLLEVFLSGKERITEHVRKESMQTRLF